MYEKLVRDLKKNPEDIELNTRKLDLMHMSLGLGGETGEVLDIVKKHVIFNKPLDHNHLIEELGDVEFYLEGIRQTLGYSREFIIQENSRKLKARFPRGYSNEAALERADKS